MKEDQQPQDLQQELDKVNFVLNGLDGNGPFNKFIEMFQEQADMADEQWQNCLIETDRGKEQYYSLRAHKLSLITILNKLEDLRYAKDSLQEELKEEDNTIE